MIGKQRTFRLLMVMYMALMIPMCCCFSSAWAAACCVPEQAQEQPHAERPHDHGHHEHDEKHLEGDRDNDEPIPTHEDDGSCDCGCDSSMDRTTPTKVTANPFWSITTVQCLPNEVFQPRQRFQDLCLHQQAFPPTCNSLLRQHCALLV